MNGPTIWEITRFFAPAGADDCPEEFEYDSDEEELNEEPCE